MTKFLIRGCPLQYTLWENFAKKFERHIAKTSDPIIILVLQFSQIKEFKGT